MSALVLVGVRPSPSVPGAWNGIVVVGSSPAEPERRRPHEADRSKLALVSSSPFLELEAFNKDPTGSISGYLCVRVCVSVGPVYK